MKVSKVGLDLIRHFESYRENAYLCPAGVWTVGYGTTKLGRRKVKQGDTLSHEDALELLEKDVNSHIAGALKQAGITEELPQQVIDAIGSFAYNVGAVGAGNSTFMRFVKAGDFAGSLQHLYRIDESGNPRGWIFATKNGVKRVLNGLIRRRIAEQDLIKEIL